MHSETLANPAVSGVPVEKHGFNEAPKIASPTGSPKSAHRGSKRPRFQELPLHPSHPPYSAWGLWGAEDQLGCLNLLTPERVVSASKLVQTGVSVGLNWELGQMKVPPFYRTKLKHEIFSIGDNINVYF